jgi:hypothetical protein
VSLGGVRRLFGVECQGKEISWTEQEIWRRFLYTEARIWCLSRYTLIATASVRECILMGGDRNPAHAGKVSYSAVCVLSPILILVYACKSWFQFQVRIRTQRLRNIIRVLHLGSLPNLIL